MASTLLVQDDVTTTPAANGVVEGGGKERGEGVRGEEEGAGQKGKGKEEWRQSLPEQDIVIQSLETSPKSRRTLSSESKGDCMRISVKLSTEARLSVSWTHDRPSLLR